MCYWNRKCCAKLKFGGLSGSWERWTGVVFFIIWPQFGGRTRWCLSFDSWARALAKLAVTNEFSSFRLDRHITNNHHLKYENNVIFKNTSKMLLKLVAKKCYYFWSCTRLIIMKPQYISFRHVDICLPKGVPCNYMAWPAVSVHDLVRFVMLLWWSIHVDSCGCEFRPYAMSGHRAWWAFYLYHVDQLIQERWDSSVLEMEIYLSFTNPLLW